MFRCPLCKSEDPKGYGMCRDCGIPTSEFDDEGRPIQSRAAEMFDRFGNFAAQAIAAALVVGLFFEVGSAIGASFSFYVKTSLIFGAIFAATAAFFGGWALRSWIANANIILGAILGYIPGFAIDVPSLPKSGEAFLLAIFASSAAAAMICGKAYPGTSKRIHIFVPIAWLIAAIIIVHNIA